jgi:hypothetical protein
MYLPRTFNFFMHNTIYMYCYLFFFWKERVKCTPSFSFFVRKFLLFLFVLHINFRLISWKSRHHLSISSFMCFGLRQCWINSTLISLLQHLWLSLADGMIVDMIFVSGVTDSFKSFSSVHVFIRRSSSTAFLFAAHLPLMRLGCLD